MRRRSLLWRGEAGGIDGTLTAAGFLLAFLVCMRVLWPLWHLIGVRTELARSLHMANRAAVGAFDRAAWTHEQRLVLTASEERLWESLRASLSLTEDAHLPGVQPLVRGPLRISVALEEAPGQPPGTGLLASRATLVAPVTAFGQQWELRLEDVHYVRLHE